MDSFIYIFCFYLFMQLTKIYRCKKCGTESTFTITTDLNMEEISVSARCPSCNAEVFLTFSSLFKQKEQEQKSTSLDESLVNEVDQLPSSAIKDIIEDEL